MLQKQYNDKDRLNCVHLNLWDPSQVISRDGGKYMLTFIDDYSKKIQIYIDQWFRLLVITTVDKISYI